MGQIKKIKAFYYIKWCIITNLHDKVSLSFLFDPLYWLGQISLQKFRCFNAPQFCSEIIWPLWAYLHTKAYCSSFRTFFISQRIKKKIRWKEAFTVIQQLPKGRSDLTHLFIDIRTTGNQSISRRKNTKGMHNLSNCAYLLCFFYLKWTDYRSFLCL